MKTNISREIKFREWKHKQNKMYCKILIRKTNILMQYTGLADKNGIEIYEGDVISFPYITPFGAITKDENTRSVVKLKHGSFGIDNGIGFEPLINFINTSIGNYIPNRGNAKIYKDFIGTVIGNIYSNPKLLQN